MNNSITTDEVLDLVNENDEIIGEVMKSKANADPSLFHREIAIILYDKDNRILFQKRSKEKKVILHNGLLPVQVI